MTIVNVDLNEKENSIVGIIRAKQDLSSKEEAIKFIINLLKPEITVKIKKCLLLPVFSMVFEV